MDKIYWDDLPDEEINELNDEWLHSIWYERVLKEKNWEVNIAYYIFLVSAIISNLLFILIFFSFYLVIRNEMDLRTFIDINYIRLPLFIGLTILFYILSSNVKKKSKMKYLEEEKSKWLKKEFNIIK